jgi:uncharacterized OsmC-like protein
MIEVSVEHLGDVQFEIQARGHRVICDQPADSGGYDEGMTPPEFLLASLASCAGYYVAEYLRAKGITAPGTRVRVTAEKVKPPARLDKFQIEVNVPMELSGADRAGVEKAVHKCLIHNTLLSPPSIGLTVQVAEAALTPA